VSQPTNKQDVLAVTTQRDAIGAMIRKAQEPPCAPPKKPPVSVPTRQRSTSPSTEAPTPDSASAPSVAAQNSGPLTQTPAREAEEPHAHTEGNPAIQDDKSTADDPPSWVQQASLSELLLWRLGIPVDRERIERERHQTEDGIDLKPPITTRKVADAIAHLSLQVMRGELDATSAKTSLYALQTLLTALRLQIIEDKKPKDARKKPRTTRRKTSNAKRQR
jgi:hypothetical protein